MNPQVDQAAATPPATDTVDKRRIAFRAYRNSLIDMLGIGASTYPVPDIPVSASTPVVQYGQTGTIALSYSQPDVLYTAVFYNAKTQAVEPATADNTAVPGTGRALSIQTIPLTSEDYTFSVIAGKPAAGISTQLLQAALIKTGIQKDLELRVINNPVTYGTPAVILIKQPQSGTRYQLLAPDGTPLSDEIKSDTTADLSVSTGNNLLEDVNISVRSTNIKTGQTGLLSSQARVEVMPNTALQPVLETASADYDGTAFITLNGTQQSALYQLRLEDIDDDTANKDRLRDTDLGDPVPGGGTIRLSAGKLKENITVSILVTKTATGNRQKLPVLVFIPVKPDTGKVLSLVAGTADGALIKVSNTQPGVMYQLRKETDGQLTGKPVYHHKNYGIDGTDKDPGKKAHIGFDFVVGRFTDDAVTLDTGPLQVKTVFRVLAKKLITWPETETVNGVQVQKKTWLEAELANKIEVTPAP